MDGLIVKLKNVEDEYNVVY